jgi:hypothetical protein
LFVTSAIVLAACSHTTTSGEEIQTGFGTNVGGTVTQQNGTVLAGVAVEARAYTNACVAPNLAIIKGVSTDGAGRFQFDVLTGSADSLCLTVTATPPAGSGLTPITHANLIVRKNPAYTGLPNQMAFDSVKTDFVLP